MNNVPNQVPYLRTSRNFPEDLPQLTVEVNKAYLDISNAVNARTVGIFTITKPTVTGEAWFIKAGQKQQTLRQVYTFTTLANIPHNIKFASITAFSRMYGQYTDGINWYGLIAGSNVAIAGQISFYVTPMNIVFLNGGGGAPTLTSGNIVLEWLSNV
jgi:hypothetical protein